MPDNLNTLNNYYMASKLLIVNLNVLEHRREIKTWAFLMFLDINIKTNFSFTLIKNSTSF